MAGPRKARKLRVFFASIFDFVTIFWIAGYVISGLMGGRTDGGFSLKGTSALILFAVVIVYFVVCHKFFRGAIWRHIFRVPLEREAA
ncbi:hypothetical protein [Trinickia dinghuensis]|uniref:RDD domain-containing protein n=1 Tax=Trinickia dinghuensis TaxID=2291023 RepID=A0A3D8K6W2_9BURK|nr:hypothetical protein [Trinickia dinghuensis]RDV00626.1 hypothetical protein DWV00_02340 [Trinickia dinghuensis]